MAYTDGSDYTLDQFGTSDVVNELKNAYAGASAPSSPVEGIQWYDTGNSKHKIYNGSSWLAFASGAGAIFPIGTINAWIGGYFTDGSNGGFTTVLSANTIAGANDYLNPYDWYVCDGSALNDAGSPIFNGAGRYLPNLTDDRFVQGDTAVGGIGGSNTQAHTHTLDLASVTSGGSSQNPTIYDSGTPSVWITHPTHTHDVDFDSCTSGVASNTENRPKYLACIYAMRIK